MAELIISTNAPCCPPKGTLWWEPVNKSLKILNLDWEAIGGCAVCSVNGKTGVVDITVDEILGKPTVSNSVYTSNGWAEAVNSAIQGSNSLITSGGVYKALDPILNTINTLQASTGKDAAKTLKKTDVETNISNLSSDSTVPSSAAVMRLVSSRKVTAAKPLMAVERDNNVELAVLQATPTEHGVVRYSTLEDYDNGSPFSVVTPNLIKPIIDEIKNNLASLTAEYQQTKAIVDNLRSDLQQLANKHEQLQQEFNQYKATHP